MIICPKCKFQWVSTLRSNQQSRYYFGVVVDILSNHTGFTPEEMHEILKHKFLRDWKKIKTVNGVFEYVYTKSTTILSTAEFENYLAKIREWAAIELNCQIPEPNEELDAKEAD